MNANKITDDLYLSYTRLFYQVKTNEFLVTIIGEHHEDKSIPPEIDGKYIEPLNYINADSETMPSEQRDKNSIILELVVNGQYVNSVNMHPLALNMRYETVLADIRPGIIGRELYMKIVVKDPVRGVKNITYDMWESIYGESHRYFTWVVEKTCSSELREFAIESIKGLRRLKEALLKEIQVPHGQPRTDAVLKSEWNKIFFSEPLIKKFIWLQICVLDLNLLYEMHARICTKKTNIVIVAGADHAQNLSNYFRKYHKKFELIQRVHSNKHRNAVHLKGTYYPLAK